MERKIDVVEAFDGKKSYLYDIIDIKKETSYPLEPKAVHDKKPIS